jgi:hypothetical protein
MKNYTRQQKDEAKAKLPKPIADFLGSSELVGLYDGIRKKMKLNLQQVMVFVEVVNSTLMGLEEEHALETNLHQWLPELSNADTRELAADVNDRIFKEARRRLEQRIVTSDPDWDEENLGPKDERPHKQLTDTELDQLVAKQDKEGWEIPPNPNAGADGDLPPEETEEEAEAALATLDTPTRSIASELLGEAAGVKARQTTTAALVMAAPAAPASVAEERLLGAAAAGAANAQQPIPSPTGIQSVTKKDIQAPAPVPPPGLPDSSPIQRKYPGGVDPYREPVE